RLNGHGIRRGRRREGYRWEQGGCFRWRKRWNAGGGRSGSIQNRVCDGSRRTASTEHDKEDGQPHAKCINKMLFHFICLYRLSLLSEFFELSCKLEAKAEAYQRM